MAATLTQERFSGPDWIFERKFDGIRVLAFKRDNQVRLFSRNRLLQNDRYPPIADAIAQLPVRNLILDGEAVGRVFHVFDVLRLDDRAVTSLPLVERLSGKASLPSGATRPTSIGARKPG